MQPPYDAVIFDMDGVVTDTVTLHARAWKQLFDEVLADPRARAREPTQPFDVVEDYRRYVDGRAREDGAAAFLTARGVVVPAGTAADPASAWTLHGFAKRKNDLFLDLVATEGVRAYPGTVDLLGDIGAGRPLGPAQPQHSGDHHNAHRNLAPRVHGSAATRTQRHVFTSLAVPLESSARA